MLLLQSAFDLTVEARHSTPMAIYDATQQKLPAGHFVHRPGKVWDLSAVRDLEACLAL